MKKLVVVLLSAVSCVLVGCETLEGASKEDTGTLIGAIAGAVVASAASDSENRTEAALIGAVVGAILGNRIGHRLDERDRRALAAHTVSVLEQNSVGQTSKWESDHTTASAEITPISQSTEELEFKTTMLSASGVMYTSTNLNFRNGPGTAFSSKSVLRPNTRLSLLGKTENGWYKVATTDGHEGYVSGRYLSPEQLANARVANELRQNSDDVVFELNGKVPVKCASVLVMTEVNGVVVRDVVETCQDENGSWGA